MWKVTFSANAEKSIKQLINDKNLPEEDQFIIAKWIRTVQMLGPDELRGYEKQWNDHPLEHEWFGHRSSSYSKSGRIIYKVLDNEITVLVVKLTPNHNYTREYNNE